MSHDGKHYSHIYLVVMKLRAEVIVGDLFRIRYTHGNEEGSSATPKGKGQTH